MHFHILLPKNRYILDPDWALFFFTGPVRGGNDWQKDGVEILRKIAPGPFYVAVPYYHKPYALFQFPLRERALELQRLKRGCPMDAQNEFPRQLNWEREYIWKSATGKSLEKDRSNEPHQKGCQIIWTPTEVESDRREDGQYGCDTRGEVARASLHYATQSEYRLAFGYEEKFYGISQIERNFQLDQKDFGNGKEFIFQPTLLATLEEGVRIAYA